MYRCDALLRPHCLPTQTEVHEPSEVRKHFPLPLRPIARRCLRSRWRSVRLRRTQRREDTVLTTQRHAAPSRARESRSLRCERWVHVERRKEGRLLKLGPSARRRHELVQKIILFRPRSAFEIKDLPEVGVALSAGTQQMCGRGLQSAPFGSWRRKHRR